MNLTFLFMVLSEAHLDILRFQTLLDLDPALIVTVVDIYNNHWRFYK